VSSADGSGIVGVGVDLIAVERVADAVERRPGLLTKLFTDAERATIERGSSPSAKMRSLAGRFAAKEAVMKALGAGIGQVAFSEVEIGGGRGSSPHVSLSGRAAERADALGVASIALSMSHDSGMAIAMAVATRIDS